MAKLLEGKILAENIKSVMIKDVEDLKTKRHAPLVLSSIEIGENAATSMYTNAQKKCAESLGIVYQLNKLDSAIPEQKLIEFIHKLNNDKAVSGIILQMPLPGHIDYRKMSRIILESKDIEGINPVNLGKIISGQARFIPCTAAAVMELVNHTGIDLMGKSVVIVGHSEIVGKPLSLLFLDKLATVTVCHIGTSRAGKLSDYVALADILVVAVGKPGLIKGEWIKKDAVVIDVGISRVDNKVVGDVEFETARKSASWITPVPGGVGPLTVTMLMRNLILAAKLQAGE